MEILVHVSAPSSARDDARYRAQVAAIASAFEPVSRPLLISDDQHHHRDELALVPPAGLPPPPADVPGAAENAEPAEPADSALLLQVPELISAPSSVSSLSAGNASATILADQANGARQTSSDSRCNRDLKHQDQNQRRKDPLDKLLLPRTEEGCPEPNPIATTTATTITNPNTNPCPRPRPWHDRQSIPPIPSPGTNQSRPNLPIPAPDQARESECPIAIKINAQPQLAPDSLESIISVIPDSQPEPSGYAQQACHLEPKPAARLHEEDDHPSHSPKRRRVEPYSPRPQTGQTISRVAAPDSPITLPSAAAHHAEKALSTNGDESPSAAPRERGAYPHSHPHIHPNNSPFPTHTPKPVSADSIVSVTETRNYPQEQHQHQHQHQHPPPSNLHHPDNILSTLPLSLRPPPPPVSSSTFTTHITPTLSMLTERLKPARTYKPTHQSRELDKLERGYWVMHINIVPPVPQSAPAPTHAQEKPYTKVVSRPASGSGSSDSSPSRTWSSTQFTNFWIFLSDFIAKEARAGWGVWCIVDRVEDQSANTRTPTHVGTETTTADNSHVPVQLKVYAWGEVAMHIYLMLYLASERRVRGMGLRWVDSWEEVVIQMP